MPRKKDEDLAERAANLAIRYAELEQQMLDVMRERDGYKGDLHSLEKHYEQTMENAKALRSQLEDMRKQRDEAQRDARQTREAFQLVRRDLDRCMGWIDKSRDCPPTLQYSELPF